MCGSASSCTLQVKEDTNDYILIIGRAPNAQPKMYMSARISGLPSVNSPVFSTLKAARDSWKDFFADNLPGPSYSFYNPPIPLKIEGSLYFNIFHGSPPGPATFRSDMKTIWEIRPITKIVFEPHS
jgi:hypothetical protein